MTPSCTAQKEEKKKNTLNIFKECVGMLLTGKETRRSLGKRGAGKQLCPCNCQGNTSDLRAGYPSLDASTAGKPEGVQFHLSGLFLCF